MAPFPTQWKCNNCWEKFWLAMVTAVPPNTQPSTTRARISPEGPNCGKTYLPREIISEGSHAVLFAENNFLEPVSMMHARIAFTTSGIQSFIWQKTSFP